MTSLKDLQEIGTLQENLGWLRTQFKRGTQTWQSSKPDCRFYSGIVKEICDYPGKLDGLVFDPLQKWLADYILSREGRIAFSGPGGLDYFLKSGLRTIFYFTEIADFFSKNPQYLSTTPPITKADLSKAKEAVDKQKQYTQIINTISSKLIGCNQELSFLFLQLSKTIKNLPQDLLEMQKKLENKCNSYRIAKLK